MTIDQSAPLIIKLATVEVGMNDYVDIPGGNGSVAARYEARFEQSKNILLSRGDWVFAKVTEPLTYDAQKKGYIKPIDCQRIVGVYRGEGCCNPVTSYKEFADKSNGQLYLNCTCASTILYITNAISVISWSPLAREALIAGIASHLAFSAGRINQASFLLRRYEDLFLAALKANSNECNDNFKLDQPQ